MTQYGNGTLALAFFLLVLKVAIWWNMPWAVVLAPFWLPFAGWSLVFLMAMIWTFCLFVAQLFSLLLSAIFD